MRTEPLATPAEVRMEWLGVLSHTLREQVAERAGSRQICTRAGVSALWVQFGDGERILVECWRHGRVTFVPVLHGEAPGSPSEVAVPLVLNAQETAWTAEGGGPAADAVWTLLLELAAALRWQAR